MSTTPEDPAKQEMEPGTGEAIYATEQDSNQEPEVPSDAYAQVAEAPSDGQQHRPMTGAEAAALADGNPPAAAPEQGSPFNGPAN